MAETQARVETVRVLDGDPFPLSFQDEVVAVLDSSYVAKAKKTERTLLVLRRGV